MSEVEDSLKRISSHRGVIGVVIANSEGVPIRTTLDNSSAVQHAALLQRLTSKARSAIRELDPQNDLCFIRLRSKKHEIVIAPDKDYMLIVLQTPISQET
ncbi:hypothetical protein SNEBB_004350 [Seison nebaliae]|nr:hypothetical protein SNEBB_004350 [Seison nebaliae]